MIIQVNFTDPSLISPRITEEDKLAIVFMDGEFLKSSNSQRYLTDNYTLETGLPRQIIQTKTIVTLTEIAKEGSTAMIYAVVGNIGLQIFLSFSMHLLWGMMNNL